VHHRWLVVLLCVVCATTLSACKPSEFKPASLNILFIGNSLTYTNNLPGMLQQLLVNAGIDAQTDSVALPNFGLQDHVFNRMAIDKIREGGWDVVVVQQGPSATEGRPSLLEYSQRFADEINKINAVPALYMVWPDAARSFDFDGVSDAYRIAAEQVKGLLFPAGEAWRAAWRLDPSLALYGPDQFHPSRLGTYLAALVMFQQLSRQDPTQLPPEIPYPNGVLAIDPAIAKTLQQAAAAANEAFAINLEQLALD